MNGTGGGGFGVRGNGVLHLRLAVGCGDGGGVTVEGAVLGTGGAVLGTGGAVLGTGAVLDGGAIVGGPWVRLLLLSGAGSGVAAPDDDDDVKIESGTVGGRRLPRAGLIMLQRLQFPRLLRLSSPQAGHIQ